MPSLCVQNLHITLCRLFEQEEQCGRPNLCHDMFMERAVRQLKSISYRNFHEESFVYRTLLQEGLSWLQMHYDTGTTSSNHEQPALPCYDRPSSAGSFTHARGKGSLVSGSEFGHEEVLSMVNGEVMIEGSQAQNVYKHGSIIMDHHDRVEVIKSMHDNAEKKKMSMIVLLRVNCEERLATVQCFLRVTNNERTCFRGAVCHVLPKEIVTEDEERTMNITGRVYKFRAKRMGNRIAPPSQWIYDRCNIVVPIADIICKVVQFQGDPIGETAWVFCAKNGSRSNQLSQTEHERWTRWKLGDEL